jgi:threonine synthase
VEDELLRRIEEISNEEIAFRVIRPYVGDDIHESRLREIVEETVNFPIPLVEITSSVFSLELFHGPTLAFKDVGARFMSRCLAEFVGQGAVGNDRVVVLVATSGDTGGAVAHGFLGVKGVDVVILFPKGKVSPVQELQLTAAGENIYALEVEGSFDDCQALVKEAFMDEEVKSRLFLTSANSINVARWLPQQFYYYFAYKQWIDKGRPPVISVPSGNFGNICAGMLAAAGGLPVSHFVAACNANDMVADYLRTATYQPKKSVPTYSNAMDVGDPSNFIRILELFGNEYQKLRNRLSAFTVSDQETKETIARVFREYQYVLDPHGAVGFVALESYLKENPGEKGFFLETAHPVKFPAVVEEATGEDIPLPATILELGKRPRKCHTVRADYSILKEFLLNF